MLLFPLFLLIIQLSFNSIFARSTNNTTTTTRHTRRAPKVFDVELVLKQAQNNDDFDENLPSKSSVIYPSSAVFPDDESDDGILDALDEDEEDQQLEGENKEIKRMPSRFYRRRFGNRYMRPFLGGGGGGGMTGMPPFGYGMRRPMPMGIGSGMNGGGSDGNIGIPGGDGAENGEDPAYPMRFNYRRPYPPINPGSDGIRGNGINGYGTYVPSSSSGGGNGNWFNNNNNFVGDGGFNGGYGYGTFRGGNSMMGGGNSMGPSSSYGPSCGPMGCSGGGGVSGMMGSNMGQGMMMRPGGGGGQGGFYLGGGGGGFNGPPPMMMRRGGGMGMGMGGGMWNGPMGSNMGGGGDDGDGNDMNGMMGGGDGPPTGAVGIHMSNNGYSYAAYIERQVRSTTIMMYTLVGCAPCQRAKHLLAVHYADVKSHFLELVGDEDWQRQLQVDLQHVTGAMTFPYIFVCGTHIGGSTDLIALHQSGQLRRMVNSCSRKAVAAAAVAAVAASA